LKVILINTWKILTGKERKNFTALIVVDIIINLLDICFLALLVWIVRIYVAPASEKNFIFSIEVSESNSLWLITLFFFLFAAKNLAAYFVSRRQFRFLGNVATRLSTENLSAYQQSRFHEYVHVDSSVHIRRIAFQPFEFCQYVLGGIQQIITQSCLVVFTITAIFLFNASLFLLLAIVLLPPVALLFYFIRKRMSKTRAGIKHHNERSFQYMLDALKGYVEANIYNRNDFFLQRFKKQRTKFSDHLFDSLLVQAMPGRIIELFAVMGFFVLIAIGKYYQEAGISIVTIGAFLAAAYKIIPGIVKLINVSGQLRAYEFSLHELTSSPAKKETGKIQPATSVSKIQFNNVGFTYNETELLNNFSMELNRGDFIGLSGRSGRGKTTILNLLLGFLSPANGEILVNDKKQDAGSLRNLWPWVSYVRQQSFFIHDSIQRNITLQEEADDIERLQEAIRISGLQEMLASSDEGTGKLITENGKNISGGQQQRIALARALYKDADLVLLDEPFNELDKASEVSLLNYFAALARSGKIVLLITHDLESLSYCNKIIRLE
jgi:ABC-type bacteriocin/lantibiotic exporter with double-glycine peptidase domain